MSKALRLITSPAPQPSPVDSAAFAGLGEHIRRLQAEAEQLGREHIGVFIASLLQTHYIAQEIALGGEAYPPGVREIAQRQAEESQSRARTLQAIMDRR
jgi:hypothetical protein